MGKYIVRLIECGYEPSRAIKTCEDFARNLPLIDLELFVQATEEYCRKNHVDKVQP